MSEVTFIPNPLADKLAEEQAKPAVRQATEQAASIAKAIAPRVTGAYADSIHVEEDGDGARLVAGGGDVDYASFVEAGTYKDDAQHVLSRAVEAAGLHIG